VAATSAFTTLGFDDRNGLDSTLLLLLDEQSPMKNGFRKRAQKGAKMPFLIMSPLL
jgi:hypothetical protein